MSNDGKQIWGIGFLSAAFLFCHFVVKADKSAAVLHENVAKCSFKRIMMVSLAFLSLLLPLLA